MTKIDSNLIFAKHWGELVLIRYNRLQQDSSISLGFIWDWSVGVRSSVLKNLNSTVENTKKPLVDFKLEFINNVGWG